MSENFFFIKDSGYAERNSHGALLVIQSNYSEGILFYCDEYDQFWKLLNGRELMEPTFFKKPDFRPANLSEIQAEGLLGKVDGILGKDNSGRFVALELPK